MRKLIFYLFFSLGAAMYGQPVNEGLQNDEAFRDATKKWFAAWKLVSYDIYHIQKVKGGNFPKDVAIEGIRRGRKWWSQDEGFGLFLVLEKLSPPHTWAKSMFGDAAPDVVTLIKKYNQ